LPLDPQVRIGGDTGKPIVQRTGVGEPFLDLARKLTARAEEVAHQKGPQIEITD